MIIARVEPVLAATQQTDAAVLSNNGSKPERVRLDHVDGLRALAALWVVFGHSYTQVDSKEDGGGLATWLVQLLHPLIWAHLAVVVFIVLSGYCLMLPVVRSGAMQLPGGVSRFFYKRARRILPPYYAALILSAIWIQVVPGLSRPIGAITDMSLPPYSSGAIVSHVVLLDNWHRSWGTKINFPLQTVSIEWQIYFLFPLLLLPLSRRFGPPAAAICGFAIGLIPLGFMEFSEFQYACSWFLGLFGLGMMAACIEWQTSGWMRTVRERVPWGLIATAFSLVLAIVLLRSGLFPTNNMFGSLLVRASDVWTHRAIWTRDALVGIWTVACLVYCANCAKGSRLHGTRPPFVLRALTATWLVKIGVFSYSLYLIHTPLQAAMHSPMKQLQWDPHVRLGVLMVVCTPIIIGIAYLFHLAFEKRFMSTSPKRDERPALCKE